jgi:hypothetical protein
VFRAVKALEQIYAGLEQERRENAS